MTITDPTGWDLPTSLPVELPTAAATYAATGVPVFPCIPGGKRPLTEHGFQDATIDLDQISAWWQRFPAANIGIPTGHFVNVLDIDVHATGTGFPILRTLHQEGLIAGWGQAVRSPSGGLHLYYPATAGRELSSWSRGRTHVDFRGVGGYIIAPPSTITTEHGNRRYELIARGKQPRPVDADRIREFLTPKPDPSAQSIFTATTMRETSVEHIAGWVSSLAEGNRNAGLFWAACRLAEAGMTEHNTVGILEPAAASAGLGVREITATIRSAHRSTQLTHDPSSPAGPRVKAAVSR
ncbi:MULTISPECIES: bifunctional DNA primase/polymerase [Micrococcaceae]|uniref:DNA primase n=1 Tax=Glutamicibacter arilaitensis TaxID=256701 RepID=A0A2N7S0X5_9MICC|nr:bifunctional DNA primase/polymerase [Glutamicibacter arilaitensis]MDN5811469.1 bifunctional DNA primase/polymerase [Micrococcaceae bacterium]PMQ19791.1 DNA primase [Glutamicibacter arilaitensis]